MILRFPVAYCMVHVSTKFQKLVSRKTNHNVKAIDTIGNLDKLNKVTRRKRKLILVPQLHKKGLAMVPT